MKMTKRFIIILVALLLVLSIAGCGDKPVTPTEPVGGGGGGIIFDPNQGDYVPPSGGGAAAEDGVAIPGFGTLTIPPNVTEINVDFYNPEVNAEKFYLTFEIRIPNDSEEGYESIYKSGLVKAGNHIQKITISRGFDKGEYDAYIFVQPYRADEDLTPVNNANLKFKLIVK